jgi:large subunit ribosomal protein L9e
MKKLLATRIISIPDGVTVTVKSMQVKVNGPRGDLEINMRKFNRLCDIKVAGSGKKVRIDIWHGTKKELACLRSLAAKIQNMVTGVTKGFKYKMRFVYNHFPINSGVEDGGKVLTIRNFLGEKRVRTLRMLDGVSIEKSKDVKDEVQITGNDIDKVSLSASQIYDACKVRNKDIRKFLDGVYISERTTVVVDEDE